MPGCSLLFFVKKTMRFNKLFTNYTSVSFLIQNSIPMGIEVQNKKISSTPASSPSASSGRSTST